MKTAEDRSLHCLIAEPDPFIATLLLRFAEESGVVCLRVKVGEDLLAIAQQNHPDIIILDPEFSGERVGWEIFRELKTETDTQKIALISCSWLSEQEVVSLTGSLTGFLQKPEISYSHFEEAIQAAVTSFKEN